MTRRDIFLQGDQSTGLKTGYVYEEVMQKHAQIATYVYALLLVEINTILCQ